MLRRRRPAGCNVAVLAAIACRAFVGMHEHARSAGATFAAPTGVAPRQPSGPCGSTSGSGGRGIAWHAGQHLCQLPPRAVQRRAVFTAFVSEVAASPQIFVGEIAAVVLLSSLFSSVQSWLRRQIAVNGDETGKAILDSLFEEITGLGFIGLLLYLVTRSGAADVLAAQVLGSQMEKFEGENPLAETFETVHMIIFLLLVVLLFQAAAVLIDTRQVATTWDEYERTRAFGIADDSLESLLVKGGYLERKPKPDAPRSTELITQRPFGYGDSLFQRLSLRQDRLHKLVMWRAVRHEFLFPRCEKGQTVQVPNPGLFSFGSYLCSRLGSNVQVLVEVDLGTWVTTLLVGVPILYYCVSVPFEQIELVLCLGNWVLASLAALLTLYLEEETYKMTPKVPEDARQMLQLFACTSSGAMRRATQLDNVCTEVVAAPGLGDVEEQPEPSLGMPAAFEGDARGWVMDNFVPSGVYRQLFRIIGFWQAIGVTSLIVAYLSQPLVGPLETALYALAWLEWPVMLFVIVPVLIRRLTLRNSVEFKKDAALVRKVSLQTKEGLLRDYMRLVQVVGLERRARKRQEPWAAPSEAHWGPSQAKEVFEEGLITFRGLPESEKLEIWKIFETWDSNNDATVDAGEMAQNLSAMGFRASPRRLSENLLRLVDHDGSQQLSWRKFKALTMLATINRPPNETQEDLETFFELIDDDGDAEITIFELAKWSERINISMDENDFGNLLYIHFGTVKPTISKVEFGEWIQASLSRGVDRQP